MFMSVGGPGASKYQSEEKGGARSEADFMKQ